MRRCVPLAEDGPARLAQKPGEHHRVEIGIGRRWPVLPTAAGQRPGLHVECLPGPLVNSPGYQEARGSQAVGWTTRPQCGFRMAPYQE